MFNFFKNLFNFNKSENTVVEAPYKVEPPTAVVEDQITDAVTITEKPAVVKAESPKKPAAKKPVQNKNAGAKKPQKPQTPSKTKPAEQKQPAKSKPAKKPKQTSK